MYIILAMKRISTYVISHDDGHTWSALKTAFMAKQMRNPQMVAFKDGFVLHGRSGNKGVGKNHFVLYTSRDGVNWDAGRYLRKAQAGWGGYSNKPACQRRVRRRA